MQSLQASDNLDEDIPNFLLLNVCFAFLITANFLEHVAIVSVLHNQAQARAGFVDKSFFVGDNVLVVDACQNSDLVQCVLFLLVRQVRHFHFLESIDRLVLLSADLIDL